MLTSYRLRLERRRWQIRALRKQYELRPIADRTAQIDTDAILCFSTVRNELPRLPYFLKYYRDLGVQHFIFVDNDSTDGSRDFLSSQPDVSLWTTPKSYKKAHFGTDWLNRLLMRYGHGRWTLVVDVDEFLIYPFSDTRPLRALTDWLDQSNIRSFGAMLLDMYPKGPIDTHRYEPGQNPMDIACWFDSGNYTISHNDKYRNLWIQGGPRARMFFAETPEKAPALNKVPLVKWNRKYVYISSTHMLLPRGLNLVYDAGGGEKATGCLLHAKFLDSFVEKASEELDRQQHYAASLEYKAYYDALDEKPDLWCRWSEKFVNWRQLEVLGLMSKGNWA